MGNAIGGDVGMGLGRGEGKEGDMDWAPTSAAA